MKNKKVIRKNILNGEKVTKYPANPYGCRILLCLKMALNVKNVKKPHFTDTISVSYCQLMAANGNSERTTIRPYACQIHQWRD
ncbi:hypothetical protein KKB18_12285 [bacterium]|nr:hypothetical protein [bacterium]